MKRLIYITILSILLLSSCSKPSPAPAPEQYSRYIFFSQGVLTKASLIEDVDDIAGQDFGVIGFKYDSDWATYSATNPTPNVFYDDNGLTDVETVTVSADGTNSATYSPLQGWANTKRYAFFAFYPAGNPAVTLANPTDGSAYTGGVPAIRYTMDPTDLKGSMVDVMTAPAHIDKFWKSSEEGGNNVANGEVNFAFSHRLSALGLNIANLSTGTVTLNSIVFKLNGIKYHEAVFSLTDGTTLARTAASSASAELSLAFAEGENSMTAGQEAKELSDKLIFIPQTDGLSIEVEINYTRGARDGYAGYTDTFTTQTLTTALAEGKKYLIYLKFTDSTVEVSGQVKEDGWVEIPDVNSSFK